MRLTLTAALVAASIMPAFAADDTIERFIKANAYAMALDEFCFGEKDTRLSHVSMMDWDASSAAIKKAREHLGRDQTACGPAREFVETVSADRAELDRIFEAWVAEREAKKEAAEKAARIEAEKDAEIERCRPAREMRSSELEKDAEARALLLDCNRRGVPFVKDLING